MQLLRQTGIDYPVIGRQMFYGSSYGTEIPAILAISRAIEKTTYGEEIPVEEFKRRVSNLKAVIAVYDRDRLDGGDDEFRPKEAYTHKDALVKMFVADLNFVD